MGNRPKEEIIMPKKVIILICLFAFMLYSDAFAIGKQEAQANMDHMKATFKHMKENLAPLINCYVKNQPRLQNVGFDFPMDGKKYIAAMSVCINQYGLKMEGEDSANAVKDKVVAAMNKDVMLGEKFLGKLDEYNTALEKWRKSKKDGDKLSADTIKADIERMKQELLKNANDFQIVLQEFNSYKNDVMDRYKKAQSDLSGAK